MADPDFWSAWRTTALFTLFALVFGYAVPFAVAVVINELRHARLPTSGCWSTYR